GVLGSGLVLVRVPGSLVLATQNREPRTQNPFLVRPQSSERTNPRGPAGGQETRGERRDDGERNRGGERGGVAGRDAVEQARHHAADRERPDRSGGAADRGQPHA